MSDNITIGLLGDNTELLKAINQSGSSISKFEGDLGGLDGAFGDVSDSVEDMSSKTSVAMDVFLGGLALKLLDGIVGAFKSAFNAVSDVITDSLDAFTVQQDADVKLEAVLKATGFAAGFTSAQMKQLAADMQEVTRFGDEVVQETQAIIATFKNIRGDEFIEATKVAADMSVVLGTDLKGAALQVAKALNDPLKGMSALSRSGVSFTEQQKANVKALQESGDIMGAQRIILEELAGEFGGAAEAIGGTFGGAVQMAKNRLGDIHETIGAAIIPIFEALEPVIDSVMTAFENAVPILEDFIGWTIKVGNTIFDTLKPAFEFIGEIVILTLAGAETAYENFFTVIELGLAGWVLGQVSSFNIVKHWMTVVLPDSIVFFAENWVQIFTDVNNFQTTILMNMFENVKGFVESIGKLIRGEAPDFKMTGLLEGFTATLKELPKIAEREIGPFEQALQDRFTILGTKLGGALEGNKKKYEDFFTGLFTKADKARVDLTSTASSEFDTPEKTKQKEEEKKKDKEDKEKAKSKADASKADKKDAEDSFSASIEGLVSLRSRIESSSASSQSPELKVQTNMMNILSSIDAAVNDPVILPGTEEGNKVDTTQETKLSFDGFTKMMSGKLDDLIGIAAQTLLEIPKTGVLKG